MDKTYVPKGQMDRAWVLVDAKAQPLGRLATHIAMSLLGKDKPTFTPGMDTGSFVIVVNAGEVKISAKRMEEKFYYSHSNYPGGLKAISIHNQLKAHPDRVIRAAVWGMLPHTKLGRRLIKKLKIYSGANHPHAAQNPQPMV